MRKTLKTGAILFLVMTLFACKTLPEVATLEEAKALSTTIERNKVDLSLPKRSSEKIISYLEKITLPTDEESSAIKTNVSDSKNLTAKEEFELGLNYLNKEEPVLAEKHLRIATLLENKNLEYRYNYGRSLVDLGKPKDALAVFRDNIDLAESSNKTGWIVANSLWLSIVNSVLGNIPEAERRIETMEKIYEESANWRRSQPPRDLYKAHIESAKAVLSEIKGNAPEMLQHSSEALKYANLDMIKEGENSSYYIKRKEAISKRIIYNARALAKNNKVLEAEAVIYNSFFENSKYYDARSLTSHILYFALLMYEKNDISGVRSLINFLSKNNYISLESDNRSFVKLKQFVQLAKLRYLSGDLEGALSLYREIERMMSENDFYSAFVSNKGPWRAMALYDSGDTVGALNSLKTIYEKAAGSMPEKSKTFASIALSYAVVQKELDPNFNLDEFIGKYLPIYLSKTRGSDENESSAMSYAKAEFLLEKIVNYYVQQSALLEKDDLKTSTSVRMASDSFVLSDLLVSDKNQKALLSSAARALAPSSDLGYLVRLEQDFLRRINDLSNTLLDIAALSEGQQDKEARKKIEMEIDKLRSSRATVRNELEQKFPDYIDMVDPGAISVKKVSSALDKDEIFISTYSGKSRLYVWWVRNDGKAGVYSVSMSQEALSDEVAYLRNSFDSDIKTLRDIKAFDVQAAFSLYEAILQKSLKGQNNVKKIIFVPHGPLQSLPISLLVTEKFEKREDRNGEALFSPYKDVPFLIKKFSITQLPSASSLIALRKPLSARLNGKLFLGIGNPIFSADHAESAKGITEGSGLEKKRESDEKGIDQKISSRGGNFKRRSAPQVDGLSSAGLKDLSPLPDSESELRYIAESLGVDSQDSLLLRSDVSEEAIKKADLSATKVVMFATHGLLPNELDGLTEPALALSNPKIYESSDEDGLLTVSEIVGLKMNADWVVLSACNTGVNKFSDPAVTGLSNAFFYAGTRSILVTNWAVETSSASLLTSAIIGNAYGKDRLARAEALRMAQIDMINNKSFVDSDTGKIAYSYAHPIFWAAFSLIGEGNRQ
jgi:CHAT domain-containing protein